MQREAFSHRFVSIFQEYCPPVNAALGSCITMLSANSQMLLLFMFHIRSEPEVLREQLQELIDAEEQGSMNPTLRLKKKALQQAYDQAIKRKMVGNACILVVVFMNMLLADDSVLIFLYAGGRSSN